MLKEMSFDEMLQVNGGGDFTDGLIQTAVAAGAAVLFATTAPISIAGAVVGYAVGYAVTSALNSGASAPLYGPGSIR
ncbi:MAG: hypothetical protein A2Y23_09970 [Clostridiales bacterium GWB2_37_7]|nr:MAG: hypothetical protein A2Y23_09970 [Clostridiales bacterium GWB2_37_7]